MEETKEGPITVKKHTMWQLGTFLFAALFVVSLFTGGFGISKGNMTGNAVADNTAGGNNGGNNAAAAADVSAFLKDDSLYPSIGPKNAKNVVIEFSDFQCPYCAMAAGLASWTNQYATQYADLVNSAGKIEQMAKDGKLRFVYVSMSFLGQESVDAAKAGFCANQQGKFWEMHDAIFTANTGKENAGAFTKANLKIIAQSITGLDKTKFNDCLDNDKTLATVQTVASEASNAASGTPTFYVNGKQVSASWQALSAAIA